MALLDYYNDDNKVVERGKAVSYMIEIEHGHWESTQGTVTVIHNSDYVYKRICNYRYKYVGMSKSVAYECKEYFEEELVRETRFSKWNPDIDEFEEEDGGSRLMAKVTVQHHEGDMYSCVIDFQEEDQRLRIEPDESVAELFSDENLRQYDFPGRS